MTKFAADKLPKALQEYLFRPLKATDLRRFMFWYMPDSGRLFYEEHLPPTPQDTRGGTPKPVPAPQPIGSLEIPAEFKAECEQAQAEADPL
jgi:hypothetical protein